jgi:L-fucose mutarotase/ribose pyranase (RbsD/FucU family)
MRINQKSDDMPDFGKDPVTTIPDHVSDKLTFRSLALASYLADRQKHYENVLEGSAQEASSMSIVERLAFYEMTIDALLLRQNEIENRLGGSPLKEGEN